MGDHKGTLRLENDDISMRTKPILTHFGATFGTLRFDEKPFSLILYRDLHRIGITNFPMQTMFILQLCTLVINFYS